MCCVMARGPLRVRKSEGPDDCICLFEEILAAPPGGPRQFTRLQQRLRDAARGYARDVPSQWEAEGWPRTVDCECMRRSQTLNVPLIGHPGEAGRGMSARNPSVQAFRSVTYEQT
jgi:hypothetical protein